MRSFFSILLTLVGAFVALVFLISCTPPQVAIMVGLPFFGTATYLQWPRFRQAFRSSTGGSRVVAGMLFAPFALPLALTIVVPTGIAIDRLASGGRILDGGCGDAMPERTKLAFGWD